MQSAQSLKAAFEEYLSRSPMRKNPVSLYEPLSYVLSQPGKRIRPVMVLMSYCLYRDDFSRAFPAALAIEYFHNFTLIHDDIMDAATLRRGKKSVNAKYGVNGAILSGDLMLIRSFDLLLSACGTEHVHQILGQFSDTAIQICEGQQLDMDFESQDAVSIDDYIMMVEKKTSVLLGCALQIGALLANAGQQEGEALQDIGISLGKAFQIQDDILDAYGEQALVGKRRGGDILQKKKSILYAIAWESASTSGRSSLSEIYNKDGGNPEVKVQQVLKLFDKLQVPERAHRMSDHLFRNAIQALDGLDASGEQLVVFRDFIQSLMARSS
jgi:geranylgeranyl diphosphate synthase type II